MDARSPSGRAVLILGMHRSGTSCLAGCLEECGLALGDVNRSAPHNRKGNHENQSVMKLQDDLLRHNGGNWYQPPDRVVWTDEHRRQRDLIFDEYQGLPIFGIKDPRTLVTLEFWREPGLNLSFVGSFRHPLTVAESLRKRDAMPISQGLALWANYNRLLLDWCEELAFELVCFDLNPQEYLSSVARAARKLGLDPPEAGFGFFDPTLRRCVATEGLLPAKLTELYDKLEQLSARERDV